MLPIAFMPMMGMTMGAIGLIHMIHEIFPRVTTCRGAHVFDLCAAIGSAARQEARSRQHSLQDTSGSCSFTSQQNQSSDVTSGSQVLRAHVEAVSQIRVLSVVA